MLNGSAVVLYLVGSSISGEDENGTKFMASVGAGLYRNWFVIVGG